MSYPTVFGLTCALLTVRQVIICHALIAQVRRVLTWTFVWIRNTKPFIL